MSLNGHITLEYANFIWVQKHLGFQIKFSKTNFCVYDLFCSSVFIHNSRSENVRKTTASAPAVCRQISVATLTFIAGFPQTDFDTKLVNFFLKLVLPVILKELQSNFLISTLRLFQKLSHIKLDNYFIYLVFTYFFRVLLDGVYYSCSYSFPLKFLP